jgi:hypothetical protein
MTTDNEKLCMAIINNSVVTSINWQGVGEALGLKVNSAQKRWKRFKDSSVAAKLTSASPRKRPIDTSVKGCQKRGAEEISDGVDEALHPVPIRQARIKKAKLESPSSDGEGGQYGRGWKNLDG